MMSQVRPASLREEGGISYECYIPYDTDRLPSAQDVGNCVRSSPFLYERHLENPHLLRYADFTVFEGFPILTQWERTHLTAQENTGIEQQSNDLYAENCIAVRRSTLKPDAIRAETYFATLSRERPGNLGYHVQISSRGIMELSCWGSEEAHLRHVDDHYLRHVNVLAGCLRALCIGPPEVTCWNKISDEYFNSDAAQDQRTQN